MSSRAAVLHLPVVQLIVPQLWRVGRVTFRPPGWVRKHTAGQSATEATAQAEFLKWARRDMGNAERWCTASVPVRWPDKSREQGPVLARATDDIRDAVGVLMLYQHARFPRLDTALQQFGLHGDIGSEMQSYTVLEGRRIVATGSRWLGVIGDWEFNRAHIREFRGDPRFAYLDDALRTAPPRRTDLQRRAISAVRNRAWGTAFQREQLQVVMLATAVEALLGADGGDGGRGEFYRITRRGAYLYCGTRTSVPRYPARPPCEILKTTGVKGLKNLLDSRAQAGKPYWCSWFMQVFDLLGDRNEALHGQREIFGRKMMSWHEIVTDELILNALEWIVARGATDLDQLDAEMDAFVAGNKALPGYAAQAS
jgi:hypothetical protein